MEVLSTIRSDSLIFLLSDNGIITLCEGLLTVRQATAMQPDSLCYLLQSANGIAALREGLLTVQQVTAMRPDSLCHLLRSEKSIAALRELKSSEGAAQLNNLAAQRLFDRVSELIKSKQLMKEMRKSAFRFYYEARQSEKKEDITSAPQKNRP